MDQIKIEGMEFFARHGYYKEERKKGNTFIVDISIKLNYNRAAKRDQIAGTIDYVKVYKICDQEMKKTKKLLESVAYAIGQKVKKKFPEVKSVKVKISKLDPPLDVKTKCFSVMYKT